MLSAISLALLAEAWVLWVNVVTGSLNNWEPGASFHTLEACEVRRAESMRGFSPTPDMRITGRNESMIIVESKDGITGFVRTVCLPASVNPRK